MPNKPLVNFVVGGAQKAGTTALYRYLCQHPQIHMALGKEAHFFDVNWKKYGGSYERYHRRFFKPQKQHKVFGDATPCYMYFFESPRRIWEYNPNMKWVLVLRNPIERAFSAYRMEVSRHNETLSFREALNQEKIRNKTKLPMQHNIFSYLARGFYPEQLRRIWTYFPKNQVLCIPWETLSDNPVVALNSIYDFLDINRIENIEPLKAFVTPYWEEMLERDKQYLRGIYKWSIWELESLLNWEVPWLD